jgi:hypothetical protein
LNKQRILEKVSASLIALLLVSLLMPIISFAMSVLLYYNPATGKLSGYVYSSDPNSVVLSVTPTTYGGQPSVSTITYTTYGVKNDLGLYDDNNTHYYSVTFDVYVGHALDTITVSDNTYSTPQLSTSPWGPYSRYDFQGSENLGAYRTTTSAPSGGTVNTPTPVPTSTPTPTPSVNNSEKGVDITTEPVLGKSEDGHSTATVTIDTNTFNKALDELKDKVKDKQVITVNIGHSNADVSNVTLSADALAKAAVSNQDTVLSIVSDNVSYELPLKLLDLASLSKSLGSDASNAKITITIEKMSGTAADKINSGAKKAGFEPIGSAIDFTITIEANGIKKEINNFGSTYVSRTITVPQDITANQASAVLYDPLTGQFSFVPATFSTVNGKTTITIKRNGNSQYLIVSSEKSFTDTKNMYATDDINLLASKLIVNGVTSSEFKPYDKITRAQFTALLVRALGLTVETTPASFSDIQTTDWYANVISTAVKAGLIKGFEDGTFRPNDSITREQMASLISKALTITGKTVSVDGQVEQIISKFNDKADVSAWASTDTAKVTQAGIMQGNAGSFSPKAFADRAQAAVTLKRLLQYLQFIN